MNLGLKFTAFCLAFTGAASAQLREWTDYRTILWMNGNVEKHKEKWPLIVQRLKELGINTGMAGRDAPPQALISSGFGYYVENVINKGLCLKFSSKVTNWSPFIDEWSKTRTQDAFVRDYCFDDPAWITNVNDIMANAAKAHAPAKPLMYDLRDELSVTISANPFDYDFSPLALAGFRDWLKTQYADLAALNQQWDTEFKTWDEVKPFSTDQIKARMVTGEKHPKSPPDWSELKAIKFDPAQAILKPIHWNFSPWCDHRTYMDISLARTLGKLRDTARQHDPATPVGIEGTQMPSAFGGYDLARLSQVLDWCEPYDIGNAREIFGSFMEGKPMLATVFEKDTKPAMRRLWHLLLVGDRGCIVWWSEDVIDWTKPDLPLTSKGQALAPVLKEMQSPLAKLFIKAKREWDPIGIHYSQPSIQVAWLVESTADGKTWPRRFSSHEATHNKHAQVRNSWLKLLQDMGYSPKFVSDDDIKAAGTKPWWRCMISPGVIACADDVYGRASRKSQWTDGGPKTFDGHGKLTSIQSIFRIGTTFNDRETEGAMQVTAHILGSAENDLTPYAGDRLRPSTQDQAPDSLPFKIKQSLSNLAINPVIRVPMEARVRTHRFTLGDARIIAFERNIEYKMSEDLAQAGGNTELEKPITFTATWNGEQEVYDLRKGKHLGRTSKLEVKLDPWQPSLYALLKNKVEGDVVRALGAQP